MNAYIAGIRSTGVSYIWTNTLETAGEDAEWTDIAGTGDYDYSTAGLDNMEGSEAVEVSPSDKIRAQSAFTEIVGPTWGTFRMEFDTDPDGSNLYIFQAMDGGVGQGNIQFRVSSQELMVQAGGGGGTTQRTCYSLAENNTYCIKWKYTKETGATGDSRMEVWVWNGTIWTGNAVSTNGNASGDIDGVEFYNAEDSTNFYYDDVRSNDADIEDAGC
jgi:hypothetical protein